VHEVWQLDMQEGVRVDQQRVATVCTIRAPFSAAFSASQAFDVTTPKCWRKLSFAELRAVLRGALIEWGTLPAVVQTDNELALSGYPTAPFPSLLTLWLVGLGGPSLQSSAPPDGPSPGRAQPSHLEWMDDADPAPGRCTGLAGGAGP